MTRRVNGEGSKPFQRTGRKGWYSQVRITDPTTGETVRRLVSAPTKTELARKVRKTIDDAANGRMPSTAAKTLTVEIYAHRWITEHLPSRRVRPGTRRLYQRTIENHIIPILGQTRITQVRVGDIEKMDARLRDQEMGESTRRLVYNVTKMIFDTAVRDKVVPVNPVLEVARPVETPTPQPYYSPAQLRHLFEVVEGERVLEHLVPLLAWTAMRVGEGLALRWADVDLDGKAPMLWVRGTLALDQDDRNYRQPFPKGKRERPIPLVPAAVRALRAARVAQAADKLAAGSGWSDEDLVFTNQIGGLLDPRNLRRRYTPLVKKAGLDGSFHALRRSTATMLTAARVPLNIVSTILGHSSTMVTQQRYTIVDTEMMAGALAELATYWDGAVAQ